MLKIAVFHEEIRFQEQLRELLTLYGVRRNLEVETRCFSRADELMESSRDDQILFLDIVAGGVDAGKRLRELGSPARFVFTAPGLLDAVRLLEAAESTAFRFLIGPVEGRKVGRILDEAVSYLGRDMRLLHVFVRRDIIYLPKRDVIEISSYQ